jgi:hypothetical protein
MSQVSASPGDGFLAFRILGDEALEQGHDDLVLGDAGDGLRIEVLGLGAIADAPDHVADLVVVAGGELVLALPAVALGLADDVLTGMGVEGGHALFRELEVVGAVEKSLLGFGVGCEHAVLAGKDGGGDVLQGGAAVADDLDVAGRTEDLDAVDVEVGERVAQRVERLLRVVAGAEQAFLFGGQGEEEQAALRPLGRGQGGEGLRQFDERRGAGGVVVGAVENLVAGQPRVAAEVVPVRGVDDVFMRAGRIGAGKAGDDVARGDVANGVGDGEVALERERDGAEIAVRGGFFEGSEVPRRRPR